ncbi:MAG: hypothetical protein RLY87_1239 [Chloroflexota bacterium]|jgi:sugar phosphate permease
MRALVKAAAIAAALAAIGNVIVYFLATAISGELRVLMPAEMPIEAAQAAGSTLMFGILGSLVVGLIALRTANPRRMWVNLTVIGLIVYGIAPFAAAGVTTAIWFNVMHIVAGVLIIPMVAKALPETK